MIHVILFHDSGGFQSSICSVIRYINEGGSQLSNDVQHVSLPPTNLGGLELLWCEWFSCFVLLCSHLLHVLGHWLLLNIVFFFSRGG